MLTANSDDELVDILNNKICLPRFSLGVGVHSVAVSGLLKLITSLLLIKIAVNIVNKEFSRL